MKYYIVKELQVIKKLVKLLKDENKQLWEDIKIRKEQNNQISKLDNTIKSLHAEVLNLIKELDWEKNQKKLENKKKNS